MTKHIRIAAALLLFAGLAMSASAQKFSVPAKGAQTFNVKDPNGRNQAVFRSSTALEDITGTSSSLSGTVTLDPANVSGATATIVVDVTGIKTGIPMRDEHLQSAGWLDAKSYPTITFTLKQLKNPKNSNPTTIQAVAAGTFTLHGVTQPVEFPVTLMYLPESEQTKKRAPGDLLVIRGKGTILLSKYGIKSEIIGQKVADGIEIELNAVASNAVK
jgi:polyisoprenoid-binding protein YceI